MPKDHLYFFLFDLLLMTPINRDNQTNTIWNYGTNIANLTQSSFMYLVTELHFETLSVLFSKKLLIVKISSIKVHQIELFSLSIQQSFIA